jgi:hypothetical protein
MDFQSGTLIDAEEAEPYLLESLKWASPIAQEIASKLWSPAVALLLIESGNEVLSIEQLNQARGMPSEISTEMAARFFEWLATKGFKTLIVEDDLSRKQIRAKHLGAAHFGDRLFRWITLDVDGEEAAQLLRSGASGYPLNAFVCDRTPLELGIGDGVEIDANSATLIVESTKAIVVSALDAEAFLVWLKPEIGLRKASV